MKFYFAPMEGLTGYIYRNAHHMYFPSIDKYFSPFIATNQTGKLRAREKTDILPENNKNLVLIPQLLSNQAADFIQISKEIRELGYQEINLNLGCPSGTVVAKNKGSGFLSKPEELERFLDEIFLASVTKISIKTRIGKYSPDEFFELIKIFNQYPIKELIIHPRTQKDYYNNKPNEDIFRQALGLSKNPVAYNGDIFIKKDYKLFTEKFGQVDTIMLGRGLLKNPFLVQSFIQDEKMDKARLRNFHDALYEGYKEVLFGEKNVLFKMKELWFYMIEVFLDNENFIKKIRKTQRLSDYEAIVSRVFNELDIK